jgi:hypothetical protein
MTLSKPLTSVFVAASLIVQSLPASAESVRSIVISADQVTAIGKALEIKIDRHSKMSKEEILTDVEKTIRSHRDEIQKAKPEQDLAALDKATEEYLNRLRELGEPDAIVAFEKAQAQELSAAKNYTFALTRGLYELNNNGEEVYDQFFIVLWGIFTVPIDMVLLPFSLVPTIVSGIHEAKENRKWRERQKPAPKPSNTN